MVNSTASLYPPNTLLRASDNIQGNILAAFNKDSQIFLFLRFTDQRCGLAWLGEVFPLLATTSQVAPFNDAFSQARRVRGLDDPPNMKALWRGLGLTQSGLFTLAPGLEADSKHLDEAFLDGPAKRADLLGDDGVSAPAHWIVGGVEEPTCVDAILTIAADDLDDLRSELNYQWTLAARHHLFIVFQQLAQTLPGERAGQEHFGFRDGISQPGVIGYDYPEKQLEFEVKDHPGMTLISPGEFLLGRQPEESPATPVPEWMLDGSYQVFRRLSQDVPGWWAQAGSQQAGLQATGKSKPVTGEQLAAKMVGRWRSGRPVDLAPDRDERSPLSSPQANAFWLGPGATNPEATPPFAHIRRMYSRDFSDPQRNRHRILRRGVPYGSHFDPALGHGHGVDDDRGLCFNAFMASITKQFEHLQRRANDPNGAGADPSIVQTGSGVDPVIGSAGAGARLSLVQPGASGEQEPVSLDVHRFVQTTGAVYAIALSIGVLKQIAAGTIVPGNLKTRGPTDL